MLSETKINSKGDTIVEVMLSMTLMTAFLFISWGITNKATQTGINSQKRVDMVNAIREQAEVIKAIYARSGYQVGTSLTNTAAVSLAGDLGVDACAANPSSVKMFFFDASLNPVTGTKLMPDGSNRIWVQYKREKDSNPDYYDFYVRACWQTVGSAQNSDNSQLIVRLNTNAP